MGREPLEFRVLSLNQAPVFTLTRLDAELLGLLRLHSRFADQRHLVLLAQMVAGLLLSQTVCFDRWKSVLPLGSVRSRC